MRPLVQGCTLAGLKMHLNACLEPLSRISKRKIPSLDKNCLSLNHNCQSLKIMELMSCVLTLIYICRRFYLKCILRVSGLHVLMSFKYDAIRGQKRSLAVVSRDDAWMVKKSPYFEPGFKKIKKTVVS